MTTPAPTPAPATGNEAVFRQSLRDMLVLLGVLTVLGVGIGYLVDGMAGVWGALIGVGIALIFSGTTVISVLKTAHSAPRRPYSGSARRRCRNCCTPNSG